MIEEQHIEAYLKHIVESYCDFMTNERMRKEFEEGLRYETLNKYIKVIAGTSVHSFIVREDDAKFKRGDILKAASWKVPAKNFVRGNVIDGTFDRITWTGAN